MRNWAVWGSGALREMLSQIPFALLTFAAMLEDKLEGDPRWPLMAAQPSGSQVGQVTVRWLDFNAQLYSGSRIWPPLNLETLLGIGWDCLFFSVTINGKSFKFLFFLKSPWWPSSPSVRWWIVGDAMKYGTVWNKRAKTIPDLTFCEGCPVPKWYTSVYYWSGRHKLQQ